MYIYIIHVKRLLPNVHWGFVVRACYYSVIITSSIKELHTALMSVWNTTKVPLHVGYNIPEALSAHAQKKTPLFFARNL